MDEIRLGNILALPTEFTIQPWIAAWSEACTGLACEGISVGFWNSVRILIPSVILSILIGALNGYALCFWRVRGADLLFVILLIGAFIPTRCSSIRWSGCSRRSASTTRCRGSSRSTSSSACRS